MSTTHGIARSRPPLPVMPRIATAKTARATKDATAHLGFEVAVRSEPPEIFRPDLRADYVLANPPFNDSDTALRDSACLQSEAKPQVVSEAKDNFRKDDDVRWQWSGATWTTRQGCQEGERGGVHQFGVPPKGNANSAWVQQFIHEIAPDCNTGGRQTLN